MPSKVNSTIFVTEYKQRSQQPRIISRASVYLHVRSITKLFVPNYVIIFRDDDSVNLLLPTVSKACFQSRKRMNS